MCGVHAGDQSADMSPNSGVQLVGSALILFWLFLPVAHLTYTSSWHSFVTNSAILFLHPWLSTEYSSSSWLGTPVNLLIALLDMLIHFPVTKAHFLEICIELLHQLQCTLTRHLAEFIPSLLSWSFSSVNFLLVLVSFCLSHVHLVQFSFPFFTFFALCSSPFVFFQTSFPSPILLALSPQLCLWPLLSAGWSSSTSFSIDVSAFCSLVNFSFSCFSIDVSALAGASSWSSNIGVSRMELLGVALVDFLGNSFLTSS